MKFAEDTLMVGLITENDEKVYVDEVVRLSQWCQANSLFLNVNKTKELAVDFRRKYRRTYTALKINRTPMEKVSSFRYLSADISKDLSWTASLALAIRSEEVQHLSMDVPKTRLSG